MISFISNSRTDQIKTGQYKSEEWLLEWVGELTGTGHGGNFLEWFDSISQIFSKCTIVFYIFYGINTKSQLKINGDITGFKKILSR